MKPMGELGSIATVDAFQYVRTVKKLYTGANIGKLIIRVHED